MSEGAFENGNVEVAAPVSRGPRARIGVGMLSAFLLHQTIVAIGAAVAPIVVSAMGDKEYAQYFHNSPVSIVWLLAWVSGVVCVWWWKKPSVKEWTLPFAPMTCFWFLACCVRADTREEQVGADLGKGMLLACVMITMLGITTLILGDKWWHRSSLERLVASIVPGFAYRHAPPDILERLASPVEPSPEILWQPTPSTADAEIQPLLPNGLPRNREIDS